MIWQIYYREVLMKNDKYTQHEVKSSGIKIILEIPPKTVNDERIKNEIKSILSSTLKEQLQKIS